MSKNFWKTLKKKPVLVLAPMHDVTDSAFRQTILKCGRPDVFFTEFAPVDGLFHKRGRRYTLHYLKFVKKEKPIVAQFFGATPENFYKSAQLAKEKGFDGIDINMGCAVHAIQKQGAGSALIKNPDLAIKIIKATKRGAGGLPVSVKTRIGFSKNEIKTWIPKLLSAKPAVITIHGRTAKQGYKGEADWKAIKEVVQLAKGTGTLVVGNGDVKSYDEAVRRAKESGCDGVMIGREALRNPWVFNIDQKEIPDSERMKILSHHAKVYRKTHLKRKGLPYFNKYIHGYLSESSLSKKKIEKLMKDWKKGKLKI